MKQTSHDSIRRILTSGFSVRDIAEPLISYDVATSATEARSWMQQQDFDVAGTRERGQVIGFVRQADLQQGSCAEHVQRFEAGDVIPDSTNLADVVVKLSQASQLFVSLLGSVGGIVTRHDLVKPPKHPNLLEQE